MSHLNIKMFRGGDRVMKKNISKLRQVEAVLLILAVVSPAFAQIGTNALMVQQSPADGGTVTPGVGVHDMKNNSQVTLYAVPKPGYQFVYWIGDVSDPTSNSTVTYLDSPKIIIAVFERAGYEYLSRSESVRSQPSGGTYSLSVDTPNTEFNPPPPPPPPPPPVPEPATILTFALGSWVVTAMRRKKNLV